MPLHRGIFYFMAKIVQSYVSFFEYLYYCPGCMEIHGFRTKDLPEPPGLSEYQKGLFKNKWVYNGDPDRPTISPSLHHPGRCHSFIEDGKIKFLPDSAHALSGQTVDLPNFPFHDTL